MAWWKTARWQSPAAKLVEHAPMHRPPFYLRVSDRCIGACSCFAMVGGKTAITWTTRQARDPLGLR